MKEKKQDRLEDPIFLNQALGLYGFKLGDIYLTGMPFPSAEKLWDQLQDFGIHFVLCLTHAQAPYQSPLEVEAASLDDQNGGAGPEDPEKEEKEIRRLTHLVVEKMKKGESVVIHCVGGTGRTGTIMAAALREWGYGIDEVLAAMEKVNIMRGKGEKGWPESSWQMNLIKSW